MLGKAFEPFVEQSSVSVMARGLAERLLHAEKLDAWFDDLESSQYTRELLFSSVYSLMSHVVCGSRKSINAAFNSSIPDRANAEVMTIFEDSKGVWVN